MARPRLPIEKRRAFWEGIRRGESVTAAAAGAGASRSTAYRWFDDAGGVIEFTTTEPEGRFLSMRERELIARWSAEGESMREVGRRLGRAASTISRELRRGSGPDGYRPSASHDRACRARRRRRPLRAKLLAGPLRQRVQELLRQRLSPQQIAGRLALEFPNDPEMRVSHETIYQAIYIQARGGLRREVEQALRQGRVRRRPHRAARERAPRFRDMVMISERPAEVEDRAAPGHWEGDLLIGSAASAIGTLVERTTGYLILIHLPEGRSAEAVAAAITRKLIGFPYQLRRTLTWDQGSEMGRHDLVTAGLGMPVYFCDPHSPWQRAVNENTNGLLRQYFPKGMDLSRLDEMHLDDVAAEMNSRPRKRLEFFTPAEVLTRLMNDPDFNWVLRP